MSCMKLLSFDVESNGLHGEAFAVGAVIVDGKGEVLEEFQARCPLPESLDSWVKEHVLPPIKDMAVTHQDQKSMRTSFWNWYITSKANATHVLACNPYPVEARFLIACQEDDLTARYFEHPFPFLDLGTLYIKYGATTSEQRNELVTEASAGTPNLEHHPRFDAWVAARVAMKLLAL